MIQIRLAMDPFIIIQFMYLNILDSEMYCQDNVTGSAANDGVGEVDWYQKILHTKAIYCFPIVPVNIHMILSSTTTQ